jgi:hypothetical protein
MNTADIYAFVTRLNQTPALQDIRLLGRESESRGAALRENPFPHDTDEGEAWELGWRDSRQENS